LKSTEKIAESDRAPFSAHARLSCGAGSPARFIIINGLRNGSRNHREAG